MKIYVNKNANYFSVVKYVLKLIEINAGITFEILPEVGNASVIIDHNHPQTQAVASAFYDKLFASQGDLQHTEIFRDKPLIYADDNRADYIATIFYMVNCMQEINPKPEAIDSMGRFRYEASFQHRFGCIKENLVQDYMRSLLEAWQIKPVAQPSAFFISHDIDNLYGSLLQDGFWALRKGQIGAMLQIIAGEIVRKPHWKNIDKVLKINSEYDIVSTFFWLAQQGKGEYNIQNADYNLGKERTLWYEVKEKGFVNGLHKACSTLSIDAELALLPEKTSYNRYHFLRFQPHTDWAKIAASGLDFDASLGFAEHYGFRNSYGQAFQPYNLEANQPYDFVEAPLTFMDTTFHKYLKHNTTDIATSIIAFYEANKTGCLLSLLWHNTYFTNYKYRGFLDEYKKVLAYLYENKVPVLSPAEIIKKHRIQW